MPEYHDFGWALQSLLAGQHVRRHAWPQAVRLNFDPIWHMICKSWLPARYDPAWYDPAQIDILATDWELADEKGQNGKDNEGV